MKILQVLLCTILGLNLFTVVYATEEYAKKTGKSCEHCHLNSTGGGELTEAGEEYLALILEESDSEEADRIKSDRKRLSDYIRFAAGFLHVFMGIFWFGTILYVHIILKPAYAAHGLPRGEVKLGLFSMLIMAITGSILVMFRFHSFSTLLETRFGILLLVKIALFLIMVGTAFVAVVFIGPKLKAEARLKKTGVGREISEDDLRSFTGENGGPTYFAFQDKVYDASQSEFWKDGTHFGRHKAGEDLTAVLGQAPHGDEKILELPTTGQLVHPKKPRKAPHEKIFYFMAYTELVFVILIILILALWKWW